MDEDAAVAVVLALAFVLSLVLLSIGMLRAYVRTPQAIVRRLRAGRDPLVVLLRGARGTWDPSRPIGPGNTRWGPARATYWLEGETVHLRYHPVLGTPEDVEGPLPELPTRPIRLLQAMFVGYLAVVVIGFAVGYAVSTGDSGRRLLFGWFGTAGAMVLVWLLTLVVNIGRAVRNLGRDRRTPAPW